MQFKTFAEVQKNLQNIANQTGASGFVKAKALYLEGVVVTDESGSVLAPEQLSYEVKLAPAMETDTAAPKPAEEPAPETSLRLAVREAIASEIKAVATPRVSVSSPLRVDGRSKYFKNDELAYRFGRFVAAARNHQKSIDWCASNGISVKGHQENVNSAGGFLVPEEFETALISLREQYGVFRRNAKNVPMGSDKKSLPRRKATLTAYAVGEAAAGTESQQTFDQVNLVAQKFMVLTTASNELNEDAFVNLGDDIGREIAYAFALKEDQCGFLGDGTQTYSGIVGVAESLLAVDGTVGNIKGLFDSSATAWTGASGIVTSDILALPARLPQYADSPSAKWYCHKTFYHEVMERLAYAAGGVTAREIREGGTNPVFYGYPVEFVQVMPKAYAAASIPLLFGDLSMAAYFGDRKQTSIAFSDSALNAFEQDEVAIRGIERFDIKVANVGDTTDSGPIVGLYL
jgi:HK97 family phage major capsid protein